MYGWMKGVCVCAECVRGGQMGCGGHMRRLDVVLRDKQRQWIARIS